MSEHEKSRDWTQNPVWMPQEGDSEYVKAIKKLMKEAWERNDREHGFKWNRDSHGLYKALGVAREIDRAGVPGVVVRGWGGLWMRIRHTFLGHPPEMVYDDTPASIRCKCGWSLSRGDYP